MKKNSKSEKLILSVFASVHSHCWLCGICEGQREEGSSFGGTMDYRRLEIHHVCKLGRKHEGWNLSRLCGQCHMLAEGHTCRDASGIVLPKVSNANVFWLKKYCDPDTFKWAEIVGNWRNGMPEDPACPDESFAARYLRLRGDWPVWWAASLM